MAGYRPQRAPWDINSSSMTPDDPMQALLQGGQGGWAGADMNAMPSPQQATSIDASKAPPPVLPASPGADRLKKAMQDRMSMVQGPTQAPRGSGKTEEAKVTGGSKDLTSSVANTLYDPNQIRDTLESWQSMPMFRQQQDDINGQRKMLAMMAAQPNQLDLSPLARLTDSWYGTKLSDGYAKPPTAQEKLQTLSAYGNKIAQDQRDMSKGLVTAFGDSRSGQINQLSQMLLNNEFLKRYQDPLIHQRPNNFQAQNYKSYEKYANEQMGGEKATEAASELSNLAQLVKDNNNPTALKELPLRLDKFITGSARISDSQIKMLGGDPSVINQIEQSIRSKAPELTDGGYLTQKNQQEYANLFQQYANERNKMRQLKAKNLTAPSELAHHGVDSTAGKSAIPDSMINLYSVPSSTPLSTPGSGGPVDPDAALKAAILKHLQDKAAKGGK